jgi:hypothetical protein
MIVPGRIIWIMDMRAPDSEDLEQWQRDYCIGSRNKIVFH